MQSVAETSSAYNNNSSMTWYFLYYKIALVKLKMRKILKLKKTLVDVTMAVISFPDFAGHFR